MTEPSIRVSHLSKRYRIGVQVTYRTLRGDLVTAARHLIRTPHPPASQGERGTLWALDDVSFEVQKGEVVGIIGRNGAGKSTLLKVLAHITRPTRGRVELRGRVGSLLEVGTGFHNELTGRENIYLNGAILGMRRVEIERKFDEIVAFAEVERFLDTPVKHYSNGMYMRLAFAVAAHLEPEILLVDEVLAVGDAAFQKKCLGKMNQVAGEGRTVLFVSHNMPAVQNLCQRGIVLDLGKLRFDGPSDQAVQAYLATDDLRTGVVDLTNVGGRFGSGEMQLLKFWMEDQAGEPVSLINSGEPCSFAVEYCSVDGIPRRHLSMSIHINTTSGAPVTLVNTDMLNQHFETAAPRGIIRFHVPKLPLTAGMYVVDLNLATHAGHTYADFIKSAAAFEVGPGDYYGTGRPGHASAPVIFDGHWEIAPLVEGKTP